MSIDDEDFLEQVTSGTIASFSHRDHVRAAFLLIRRDGERAAARTLRAALRELTRSAGAPERYHETITVAWVRLIAAAMGSAPPAPLETLLELHPEFRRGDLLDDYYSREVLLSPAARRRFVGPDRSVLPGATGAI